MTTYNTSSDSANTAVRAFLTKVGEYYLGRTFNTGSGKGKDDWERIKKDVFGNTCAYCGIGEGLLQMEHLVMFNRSEYGLHHPGNIAPCCKECNKRKRNADKIYLNWEEHLKAICLEKETLDRFEQRRDRIKQHMSNEGYPSLSTEEVHAIRVIAGSLYENIKLELDKSLEMYKELDKAFLSNNNNKDI